MLLAKPEEVHQRSDHCEDNYRAYFLKSIDRYIKIYKNII